MNSIPRIALVTGGTRGIGLSVVQKLLERGHTVIATGRTAQLHEPLNVNSELLSKLHLRAFDLTDIDQIENFAQGVLDEFGSVDILVNNAGVSLKDEHGHSRNVHTSGQAEFDETMRINVLAPMLLTQQFLPVMQQQKWGRIVNVASLAGRSKSAVSSPIYMMSKAALLAWTRAVAQEMAPYGIACNSVAPGRIRTKMAMQGGAELNERIAKSIPAGRIGDPQEVAHAIEMLCHDHASFTIGACLDVNGGVFMS